MATLAELTTEYTSLLQPSVDHLLRLTVSWSLLADLSFSDMLLMTKVDELTNPGEDNFVVLGQMRPNNRSTLMNEDLVGTLQRGDAWPLVRQAFDGGMRVVGEAMIENVEDRVPVWCVPVRFEGVIVAVLVRLQGPLRGPASLYEQAYLSVFERLCDMVADATFPYREDDVAGPGMPRVGDGIILIDGDGLVEFATPNATNALHRLGIYAPAEGRWTKSTGATTSRSSFTACHYWSGARSPDSSPWCAMSLICASSIECCSVKRRPCARSTTV